MWKEWVGKGPYQNPPLLGDKVVGCWLEVLALNSGLGVPTGVSSKEIEEAGREEAIPETTMLGPEEAGGSTLDANVLSISAERSQGASSLTEESTELALSGPSMKVSFCT